MRFEFRIDGGNSGVHFRSKENGKWDVQGYQADISEWEDYTGVLYASHRAQLAYRGQEVHIAADGTKTIKQFGDHDQLRKKIRSKDWNDYHVVAKGPNIEIRVNGVLMSKGTDLQKDAATSEGLIAIQLHDGPPMKVQIRKLQIRHLRNSTR